MNSLFKERIYYFETKNGMFIGRPVNISGVMAQANSLEELKDKLKALCQAYINHNQEIIKSEKPFDFVEVSEKDWVGLNDDTNDFEFEKFKRLMVTRKDFKEMVIGWLTENNQLIN